MPNVAGKVMPRPRGPYDPAALYMILDMTVYNNKLWMSKKNNLQGIEPSESNKDSWMLCIDSKAEDLTVLEAAINTKINNVNTRIDGVSANVTDLQAKDEEILASITSYVNSLQAQISTNSDSITALQNRKADKSTSVTTSIHASGWSSDGPPYMNTIAVDGVTDTNIVDVVLPDTLTVDQIVAYQEAQILNGSQITGSITLNCWGVVPIIDLPVTVIVRG